jgi:hypothetical protein
MTHVKAAATGKVASRRFGCGCIRMCADAVVLAGKGIQYTQGVGACKGCRSNVTGCDERCLGCCMYHAGQEHQGCKLCWCILQGVGLCGSNIRSDASEYARPWGVDRVCCEAACGVIGCLLAQVLIARPDSGLQSLLTVVVAVARGDTLSLVVA